MADLGCVYRNSETKRYAINAKLTTRAKVWGTPGSGELITTNLIVERYVSKVVFGPLENELSNWTDNPRQVIKQMEAIAKLRGTIGDRCFNFEVKGT